ncbi:hypothetical protein D3C84_827420 [compost metagenome]
MFVFQADVLLAGDGAAVDLVAAGGVEREATHDEVFVVADRRVALTHRGIVLQDFAEQAGLPILDQGFGDHRNRGRRIEQWRRLETADRGAMGLVAGGVFARHGHRRQFGVGGMRGGGQQQAQGQKIVREPWCGRSLAGCPVKPIHENSSTIASTGQANTGHRHPGALRGRAVLLKQEKAMCARRASGRSCSGGYWQV